MRGAAWRTWQTPRCDMLNRAPGARVFFWGKKDHLKYTSTFYLQIITLNPRSCHGKFPMLDSLQAPDVKACSALSLRYHAIW